MISLLLFISCNKALYKPNSTSLASVSSKTKADIGLIKTNKITDLQLTIPVAKPMYIWASYYKYLDDNDQHRSNDGLPKNFDLEDTYTYKQIGLGFYKYLSPSFLLNSGAFYGTGKSDYYDSDINWFSEDKYWRVKADYKKYGAVSTMTFEHSHFDFGFFFKGYTTDFQNVTDPSKSFNDDYRRPIKLFFTEHGAFARLKIKKFRLTLILKGLTQYNSKKTHHDIFDSELLSARFSFQI